MPTSRQRKSSNKKQYQQKLAKLEKTGIYEPTGKELTEWRKRQINKRYREYEERLTSPDFKFVDVSKRAEKKTILRTAKKVDYSTTRKGVFIPAKNAERVSIRYDKKHKEFEVVKIGRARVTSDGRVIRNKEYVPLVEGASTVNEEGRIRRRAKQLGPLGKNDVLVFKIKERGRAVAWSKNTYSSLDNLINDLKKRYRAGNEAAQMALFRHITIEKWENREYVKTHPTRDATKAKNRRRAEKRRASKMGIRKSR